MIINRLLCKLYATLSSLYRIVCICVGFLADRTNGRTIGTRCVRLSSVT